MDITLTISGGNSSPCQTIDAIKQFKIYHVVNNNLEIFFELFLLVKHLVLLS